MRKRPLDYILNNYSRGGSAINVAIVNSEVGRSPLLDFIANDEAPISEEQLKLFVDKRYNVASHFEKMLRRALELALEEGKTEIAVELRRNLNDEVGVPNPPRTVDVQGESLTQEKASPVVEGDELKPHQLADLENPTVEDEEDKIVTSLAHATWREHYMDAMEVPLLPEDQKDKNVVLYAFDESDSLPTLLGKILAAEITIPREDKPVLAASRRLAPEKFTKDGWNQASEVEEPSEEQILNTRYLEDHIHHDAEDHFPYLLQAVKKNIIEAEEIKEVMKGVDSFAQEREKLYSYVLSQMDPTMTPAQRNAYAAQSIA